MTSPTSKASEKVILREDVARELIDTKLRVLREEINKILQKWKMKSAEELIEKTRNGKLAESEHDAIVLTNLLQEITNYENLLQPSKA